MQTRFSTYRFPDIIHMVSNHHLKLPAAFNDHDHAQIFLQPFGIRFLIFFQFEAKPGGTMDQTDDVLFAPYVAENILRQSLIFHLDFLSSMPAGIW
ncbi:hypothetical protein D3C72_1110460 [compost metagenome]